MDPAAADDSKPVLAQDLRSLRVDGKIAAALWTVRGDWCTLQLVLPAPGNGGRAAAALRPAVGAPSRPVIDLWLMGTDGSVIRPHFRRDPPAQPVPGLAIRPTGPEVYFRFPREAGALNLTAVLTVDGQQFTEAIRPLGN